MKVFKIAQQMSLATHRWGPWAAKATFDSVHLKVGGISDPKVEIFELMFLHGPDTSKYVKLKSVMLNRTFN
jgi:hypothetical protein